MEFPEIRIQRSSAMRGTPQLAIEEATWAANDPKAKFGTTRRMSVFKQIGASSNSSANELG
jgi:hypothetical protein